MLKKDLGLGAVIGGAVGLLVQPILGNIGQKLAFIGASPSTTFRMAAFVLFLILGPVGVAAGYLLGKVHATLYQFTKFAAVGTLNSFLSLGAVNALIVLTGAANGWKYNLFVFIGFLLATTNSFIWNRLWTFQAGGDGVKMGQTFSFYAVTAVGALLNVGLAGFIVNHMQHGTIPDAAWANVGALGGIGVSFMWNFLAYKFFVFKKPVVAAV